MSSSELKKSSKPDLHLVGKESYAPGDIRLLFSALLATLSDVHMQNPELRQLWLETHWLQSDFEQNVMSIPTSWELMIMQIARGRISPSLRPHVNVVRAAANLGDAIKQYLKKRMGDSGSGAQSQQA